MINGYRDHAANERTFLAWVRTGIAVIAFGFVVENFNVFVLAMASTSSLDAGRRLQLERLSGPFGRYDGLALIFVGLALLWLQPRALSGPGGCSMTRQRIPPAASAELILSAVLALIVAGFSALLVLI
jgi:putative membrane protein